MKVLRFLLILTLSVCSAAFPKITYIIRLSVQNLFPSIKESAADVSDKEGTILNEIKSAKRNKVAFDAGDLIGGIYIYQLKVNDPEASL